MPFGDKMLQESFIIGVYISALEQIWTSIEHCRFKLIKCYYLIVFGGSPKFNKLYF